ncbi:MAG: hypothetical protein LUC93_09035 [Planctomycetaceae bacterium]|nr:hypothetical protein [Planctomycetaceae bacterium]
MNTGAWVRSYLDGVAKEPVPCLFYPAVSASGTPMREALFDPECQSRLLLDSAERYPAGAVVRMSELWCEAAACGATCTYTDNAFPVVTDTVADAEALDEFHFPEPVNDITRPMIEAVRLVAPRAGKPVFVGVTGPFTLASVLAGTEDFLMAALSEPEEVISFLDRAAAFIADYAAAYKDAGAAGVMLAEPSIAMIAPDMAEDLSSALVRRIIDSVQDDDLAVIYHNCGDVRKHLGGIAALGAKGYHFGDAFSLTDALESMPATALVFGNIHPAKFASLTPDAMAAETAALCETYRRYPNFVPSSGCDIGPSAAAPVVDAFFSGCL